MKNRVFKQIAYCSMYSQIYRKLIADSNMAVFTNVASNEKIYRPTLKDFKRETVFLIQCIGGLTMIAFPLALTLLFVTSKT